MSDKVGEGDAQRGVLFEEASEEVEERRGHEGTHFRRDGNGQVAVLHMVHDKLAQVAEGVGRRRARNHLVDDGADGPQVGLGGVLAIDGDFRGHPVGRADQAVGHGVFLQAAGEAEVGQLEHGLGRVGRGDEHVFRLEIAVDSLQAPQAGQPFGQVARELVDEGFGQAAAVALQQVGQRAPAQLHEDEQPLRVDEDVFDLHHVGRLWTHHAMEANLVGESLVFFADLDDLQCALFLGVCATAHVQHNPV